MLPALMLLAEGMVEFGRQAQRIADQLEYINGLADPVD